MHCVTFHNVEKETKKTYKGLNARCRNHPISLSWDALRVKRLAKSRPCGLQKRPGMKPSTNVRSRLVISRWRLLGDQRSAEGNTENTLAFASGA